ncbi:MAG: hypothetical protein COW24_03670 [Candidatus Kerfeldbacteria bacterium CG15_BIG_FIL_POST_REV_8_21_14_020_45_12]|uniref:Uncharacterized protein n=1 Tax=Candidatus Kerfeldbacteria bacterium CG15_BIG_FIL_POST_REV_8_21_14_020_45_12 TaxID=2014247 RepID=A0A2M7H3F2_9BACT|nr:MAG: hypothetical protein COW24_03670 [Candidatus Kerfeldbacteria bacterium CG15_BIG_FIL_POST_REV_8_21_14_020_45_12]PJA93798.1 MAG: hypothetical protein CO132_01275 [Candidatus Kerfeldbacteria bacterium CG_4_9_14_3_um_filter_45_8]
MNLTKVVFKNFSYIMIGRVLFRFLNAAIMIYAARYLGVDRYGMFETALAWANAFLALNDVGMSTLIVREGARDESKIAVYFGNTLLVEVIFSIILYATVLLVGFGIGYNHTTMVLLAILGAGGLIFEFRKVMRGIFRIYLKLKVVAFLEVLNGIIYFLLTLWIVTTIKDIDVGLLGIAHANLWTNVLFVAALFFYTLRFVKPKIDRKQIWPMIKQSYVFTLYNLFFMLYFQIDQIILSILKPASEVGIYSASAKLVGAFLFIPVMLFQVTMPIMYQASREDMPRYKRINHMKWRYLAAFGIPAGVGLWLLAPQIINFVFGEKYLASIPVLAVMGWFLAIRFTALSQGNSLTTTDRQGLRAFIQILSLVLNIVLDIILIKKYGALGAGIATLITEACIATSYLYFSAKYLEESVLKNSLSLLPIVGATLVMSLAVFLAKDQLHVIFVMLLGVITYLPFLWIFRFFRPYDKQILQQIMSKP